MKNNRHEKIKQLIQAYPIDRQETLLKYLNDAGYPVTQATVSRDIRQLHIIKIPDGNGGYMYSIPAQVASGATHSQSRFNTIFKESVLKADYAGNTMVVKCYSGMASAACELFDSLSWENVVGTLSGDDTFFVLMRTEADAAAMTEKLQEYIHQH